MLPASIVVFIFALLGGSTIAWLSLTGKKIPILFPIGHGIAAATGFIILVAAVITTSVPVLATVAMWIFVSAACGGAWLLIGYYIPYKPLPPALIFAHAGLAVTALALLLAGWLLR
jgi:hypothetical protein